MERRNFLINLGLVGAAVAAPVSIINAAETARAGITDLSTTTLKGRVTAAGRGIQGVAVTDGINTTRTTANGAYELLSNKTAQFVYLSIPSGYEIPHQNSISKFFAKIDHSQRSFNSDFRLTQLPNGDDKYAFVVWADTQIQNKQDAELLLTQSAPDLKALVDLPGYSNAWHRMRRLGI